MFLIATSSDFKYGLLPGSSNDFKYGLLPGTSSDFKYGLLPGTSSDFKYGLLPESWPKEAWENGKCIWWRVGSVFSSDRGSLSFVSLLITFDSFV